MKIVFINNVKIKPKAGKADDIVCFAGFWLCRRLGNSGYTEAMPALMDVFFSQSGGCCVR